MIHIDFGDLQPCMSENRREKAVHPVEGYQQIDMIPMDRLQGTASIADSIVKEPASHLVCDARGGAAAPSIFALGTASYGNIALPALYEIDQFGNIGRVILPVPVEHHENVRAGEEEASKECPTLAPVLGETQWGDAIDSLHPFPRPIRASVIDRDHLGTRLAGDDLPQDELDAFFLVVEWDHDAHRFRRRGRIA